MLHIRPDYYDNFSCIADKCKHNCCIGWEIDIDENTAEYYKNASCTLSNRFASSINFSAPTPHFILAENDRCPFLNCRNLCDIITHTGEEHLCTICAEHPRFHNELPGRIESGLGMCCEEAARIILCKKEPVTLLYDGANVCADEIIDLRDKIILTLQNRSKPVLQRLQDMLRICSAPAPESDKDFWTDVFLRLERLDDVWTQHLTNLKACDIRKHATEFDAYINERETEYEQFCVYLVYRHFANAPDMYEAQLRAMFVYLSYFILRSLATMLYTQNKAFTTEDHIELCRLYSAEIEYSDENLYALLDELC